MKNINIDTKGKVTKDTTIAAISDLHIAKDSDFKRLNKINEKIGSINPNYIFILGDILNYSKLDSETMSKVIDYLTKLSSIAPLYMIYGNHDKMTMDDGWKEYINWDFIKRINSLKYVKSLVNETVNLNENISLTGTNFPYAYYEIYNEDFNTYVNYLIKCYQNGYISSPNEEAFNIFLQHSPNNIFSNDDYTKLKDVLKDNNINFDYDLIVSGHLHNGLIPTYMSHILPGNTGLVGYIGSNLKLFKKDARESKDIDNNTKGVILPAVKTFSGSLEFANAFYPAEVQTLSLKK